MNRNGPISPLSMNSNESVFASRYGHGNLGGTPNDPPYNGGPYGAARPKQTSLPGSQHPSGSTDRSRPSASSGSMRPPSSASSIGGRSDGRMGMPNRDSDRSMFKPDNEEALHRHYAVLRHYLASHLHDEKGNVKPNRARDKLLRLSVTQFMELSTDVYDELLRREDDRLQRLRDVPPFLLPKNSFHPKRNQAREKLSTLPIERFRQLATDVFYELERRIPRFAGGEIDRPVSAASSSRAPSRGGMRPLPGGSRGPPPGGPGRPPIGPNGIVPPQFLKQGLRSASPGPNAMGRMPGSRRPSESLGRPLPKTFQSNTIVPNKSTMIEDDDDEEGEDAFGLDKVASGLSMRRNEASNHQGGLNTRDQETIKAQDAEIANLKEQVESLEGRVLDKEREIERVRSSGQEREDGLSAERNEWFNLREELEQKQMDAQHLNDDMRKELELLNRNKSIDERELQSQHDRDLEEVRAQIEDLHSENEQLKAQLYRDNRESGVLQAELDLLHQQTDDLQHQLQTHQAENEELRRQAHSQLNAAGSEEQQRRIRLLEEELGRQETLNNEVRQEAHMYLQDMRELSRQNDNAVEQEEKLAARVSQLEKEMDDWRERYVKVKVQNRSLRASTMGLGLQTSFDSGSLLRTEGILSEDGLVKDVDVTRFQMAVDDLLKAGRQTSTDAMLKSVKQVTLCVQSITSNVGTDGYPTPSPSPMTPNNSAIEPSVAKLKARVMGTANSLITATKQHASASGLSPVALLDAAASNLTASVVELVKAVGIRPSSKDELIDADLDSFYDDRASSADVERSPALEVKPAPLNVGRSNTTKKPNGWFRWGKGGVDDPSPSQPEPNGDEEEDVYDAYR